MDERRICIDCRRWPATRGGLCGRCQASLIAAGAATVVKRAPRSRAYTPPGPQGALMKPEYVPPVRPVVVVYEGSRRVEYTVVFDGR